MKYQTNHSFKKNSTFRIGFKLRLKFLISPTLLHPNNFPPCYFSINIITFTERISPVSILTAFPNLIFTRSRESSRADYFAVISNTRYTPDISDIPVTSIHTQRISNYQVFSKTSGENTLDYARFDYHRNTGWKIVSDRAYASFRNAPESRIMSTEYIYIYYAVCFLLLAAIFGIHAKNRK